MSNLTGLDKQIADFYTALEDKTGELRPHSRKHKLPGALKYVNMYVKPSEYVLLAWAANHARKLELLNHYIGRYMGKWNPKLKPYQANMGLPDDSIESVLSYGLARLLGGVGPDPDIADYYDMLIKTKGRFSHPSTWGYLGFFAKDHLDYNLAEAIVEMIEPMTDDNDDYFWIAEDFLYPIGHPELKRLRKERKERDEILLRPYSYYRTKEVELVTEDLPAKPSPAKPAPSSLLTRLWNFLFAKGS